MELLVFVLFVWLFVEWMLRRHYQHKNDQRFTNIVAALNRAEREFNELKKLPARVAELEKHTAAPTSPTATQPAAAPAVSEPKVVAPTQTQAPAAPSTPPKAAAPTIPPAPTVPSLVTPPEPAKPAAPPAPPRPTPHPTFTTPSMLTATPAAHAPAHVQRKSSEIEEKLGKNWLNKIGIAALVIGIALFLAYKFPTLNNPEKVGLGYFVSFAILGLGVYLERKDLYRIFARALIGGGWALVFFTTYAMHFVKYTQVIDTEWVDLVLLFAVAWMMVAHTLRYNSQVVTGLAFLLGYTTVAISQNTVYCLAAGAILAIGLVAIIHRRSWFELEVFGLAASYLNHYIWLRTVIEPMGGHKHMFPEFAPSAVLLCLYWAIYRWSYIARRIQRDAQELVSTLAALLNTGFLLVLLKYQSVRPELAFYTLLILGAVELTLGQLPVTRARRTAVVILSTIGVVLLLAAIPFKYSGMDMAIIWLAQAQLLFLAGVITREALFRRFGMLAALLTAGDMLIAQAEPVLETRLTPGNLLQSPEYQMAVTFGFAGLLFYGNAHWIPRRWKEMIRSEFEQICFRGLSYLAGLMLFVSLRLAYPNAWTAVAWAAAALALCVLGRALNFEDMSHQAHGFALAAFLYALGVDRVATGPYLNTGLTLRLVTLSLVIALFYLCARWAGPARADYSRAFSAMYTTAAAILVVTLSYYECHWAWMGIAWGGFALALAGVGIFFERRDLSYQAHALALAGFVRTLVVNIDATQEYHHMTLRFITFTVMTALLYLCAFLSGPRDKQAARVFSAIHSWAGSILIGVLAYKEVSSSWIAVTWALFALVLLMVGNRLKRMELHVQAYLLSVGAVIQVAIVNLYVTEPFGWYPKISVRLVTVALTAALLYLSAWFAKRGDLQTAPIASAAYAWAGSLLVWLLMLYELYTFNVALGWAALGIVAFEIGLLRRSVNWRLQGYLSFASAFVRIFLVNTGAPKHEMLVTTLPLAIAFYYVYWRLQSKDDFLSTDRQALAGPVLGYLGSATVATVLYCQLDAGWVAAGWAGFALLLIAVAWSAKQDVFLHQSMLLAAAVFFRVLGYDLVPANWPFSSWTDSRSVHVAVAAGLLFGAQLFAFPLRSRYAQAKRSNEGGPAGFLMRRPEQIFFFIPLTLITLLIARDVSEGRVTMAWGIEAVIVFLFALSVGERSFRLTGVGLLLLCVGKILVLDVWRQNKSDRFVTFIILGIALLLVSFLYTRYGEAIKRYL